jgi:UDP-N-acetylglucosamine--N-acetylmuramyl-(pentapeptide) pyrophosphoryl-undecaprenol N-acetylglucosamine transferase
VVDRVFTTYGKSRLYFSSSKVVETGTPVRWRILPKAEKREGQLTLLVFGGSAGARRINLCLIEALEKLKDLAAVLQVIHQTGEADFASVQNAYKSLPFDTEVVPFIEQMDRAYARADLIVCRAGASTVAEITIFGKAAILVPYPHAAYDHQRRNGQELKDCGAAEMILDEEISGEKLAGLIRAFYLDRKRLEAMGKAAGKLGRPEAAARIVDECYALVQQN